MQNDELEIFLAAPPGLETTLAEEAAALGFHAPEAGRGGVTIRGGWAEVRRANLALRGAQRVLVRIGGFRAMHLAQLDKRARKFPWGEVLRPDVPVRVEAVCRNSKIYHAGAATKRVETALREEAGITIDAEAPLRLLVRIDDDFCAFSLDTSGEPLHRRGFKEAVGKAPMRENLAALFLRRCGYDGTEPVVDPMCGSGTFPIEAAEIAAGLLPGRARAFAFEQLANHDPAAWAAERAAQPVPLSEGLLFRGSDRDAGAVRMATQNAARAGVNCVFANHAVSDLERPEGPPGLVMVNPPYGARIGDRKLLFAVYGALGATLKARFRGWRVGMVTSDAGLAKASDLPFLKPEAPVAHGGLKVSLFRTEPLK